MLSTVIDFETFQASGLIEYDLRDMGLSVGFQEEGRRLYFI